MAALAAWLRSIGVTTGDRVAALMPNRPETIVALLAVASIGAIWSSASPDFGVDGVIDRFGQIEPKVLIGIDGYHYAGKRIDVRGKLQETAARLPTLKQVLLVPWLVSRAAAIAVRGHGALAGHPAQTRGGGVGV